MEQIVVYLLMGHQLLNLEQKILRLQLLHCAQETFQDWPAENKKNTGLNGYIYDSSADHDAVSVDDILDIHKY